MTITFGGTAFGQASYGGVGFSVTPGVPLSESVTGYACTFALDEASGDLAIPIRLVRGPEAIAQRVRSRLRFFLGEWFLDQRLGVPYFQKVFVKNPSLPVVSNLLQRAVKSVPGVVSCTPVRVVLDKSTRKATANFEAVLDDGTTLTAADEPFILS